MSELRVASEFSPHLGGRYIKDGPWSGEQFRREKLESAVAKAIHDGHVLQVNFDGVAGTPTSFLEEAFGGLVRDCPQWSIVELEQRLRIVAPSTQRLASFMRLAHAYMVRAAQRRDAVAH